MSRFTAAHRVNCLMLLGSPPDMVHGTPSHRTRPFAHPLTQSKVTFISIIYILQFYKSKVQNLFIKNELYIYNIFAIIKGK